jgi:hypothetical protein
MLLARDGQRIAPSQTYYVCIKTIRTLESAMISNERCADDLSLKQKRQTLQATPEERIAQLEVTRADLVLKKNEMERKIAMIAEKRRAREQGQTDGR